MKQKLVTLLTAAALASAFMMGCGSEEAVMVPADESKPEVQDVEILADEEVNETEVAEEGEKTVLKCVCDLTPHSEILNAAADALAAEGIELDIVSTTWDATWNDMLVDGEIDFAYFMHVPAMESIEEEMGAELFSMGGVHEIGRAHV